MSDSRLFSVVRPLYPKPLVIAKAEGCHVFDPAGRRFLDAYAGVASVSIGHAHPRFVAAIADQVGKVHHTSMLYQHPPLLKYLPAIAKELPPHLNRHFFVNSGSEAIDLACQTVRAHRRKSVIISLTEGFHGGSYQTKSITGLDAWQPMFGADQHVFFFPVHSCRDCARSGWGPKSKRLKPLQTACEAACLNDLETYLRKCHDQVAGLVIEPVLGVGGILLPSRSFFERINALVKTYDIDLICDEVQSGFGRCGTTLFGFQRVGLRPHLVGMAKGIANGFPMGLVSAEERVSLALDDKMHFSTFGGNPLSCRAALETLRVINDEGLAANAGTVGELLLAELNDRLLHTSACLEIRGTGLFIGVELAESPHAIRVVHACYEKGLLIGLGGRRRNVIRIEPPLPFTAEMARQTAETLVDAIHRG